MLHLGKRMNTKTIYHFLAAVALCLSLVFSGCSKEEEELSEEKGRIDKMTDEAADIAVKKIRTPMDKARAINDLGNERTEAMDKALQDSR
jgi:hypothetical protein